MTTVLMQIKSSGKIVEAKSYGFGYMTPSGFYHRSEVKVLKVYQNAD